MSCVSFLYIVDINPLFGEGNGNPLQYSCLENPRDRGTWQPTVRGVARVGRDLATKPRNRPVRGHMACKLLPFSCLPFRFVGAPLAVLNRLSLL